MKNKITKNFIHQTSIFILILIILAGTYSAAAKDSNSSTGIGSFSLNGKINPIPLLNGQIGLPIIPGYTRPIAQLTGLGAVSNTAQYNIIGTDLGIMWDNGYGEMLTLFGDTLGISIETLRGSSTSTYNSSTSSGASNIISSGASNTSAPKPHSWRWRSNILLRSYTKNPAHGIFYHSGSTNFFGQIRTLIDSPQIPGKEVTRIPTGAISVNGVQYMAMMSIKRWLHSGQWITNFSNLAISADNGQYWLDMPFSRRYNTGGNQKFQMIAFLLNSIEHDGYVYLYGTPQGRKNFVYAARVPETEIPNLSKYEYWNGKHWILNNPSVAKPIVNGAAELSINYNRYLQKYVMLTANTKNDVVLRTAYSPQGPWSQPVTLLSSANLPTVYAPILFPYDTGNQLYFVVSVYNRYNVILMRTPLDRVLPDEFFD